ncbi:unnamed protein product [Ceutorhynchus assimilis]|uniref:RRM domain-containing protein n=1 Tax=Ceutorhynchus assimilis TaxID=467358 RepID=A0A9P0DNE1_9CUCU|nr:unnamed protein product [Ceutorhynchus assimilis]
MSFEFAPYIFHDQIYRQVIFHRDKNRGFRPEKESELHVTKIPFTANVFDLFKFFDKVGKIFQVKLMMKEGSASNRGFGFITYFSKNSAQEATNSLTTVPFIQQDDDDNYLLITKSLDNCRIFLRGIARQKSKEEIWMELERIYRGVNIVDVIVHGNPQNVHLNRGYVFVEFPTHEEAARARVKLRHCRIFGIFLEVEWALPLKNFGQEEISKVKILFVRNLDLLLSRFQFGMIIHRLINCQFVEKIHKFENHAFIHLITHEHAEQLLEKLKAFYNGTTVEVCFATPPNKFADKTFRNTVIANRCQKFEKLSRASNRYAESTSMDTPPLSVSPTSTNTSSALKRQKDILEDLEVKLLEISEKMSSI